MRLYATNKLLKKKCEEKLIEYRKSYRARDHSATPHRNMKSFSYYASVIESLSLDTIKFLMKATFLKI